MTQSSLTDWYLLINQQIASQERVLEYNSKAVAMLEVVLNNSDFFEQPKRVVYDYLWTLSDIVNQTKVLNEQLLTATLKMNAWLLYPGSGYYN